MAVVLKPRNYVRKKTSLPGHIRVHQGTSIECEIVDLSVGGAKIEAKAAFDKDEHVLIKIGALKEYTAIVAWARGRTFGVRFTESEDEMAEVLMALAVYG